jgi:hypothetical protein
VAFKIVADCILKRGDIAYNTWKKIAYNNPLNPNNGMEAYVVSNMYIGPECDYLKGFAPMSWVTGTAGCFIGVLLNICVEYKRISMD